jgi:hypothetical protein
VASSDTGSHVYGDGDEAYKLSGEGVKENSGFRSGWVGAKLLEHLALTGAREFNLTITAREIGVDVRRLYQTVVYFIKRHIVAKVRRGWYRILVDPWELLQKIVVQGPNARKAKESVKENNGTRSEPVRYVTVVEGGGVGLFFDNVRGYTLVGGFVGGDRGRVLGRGDLVRFDRVSYAEVSVATGTELFKDLGVLVIYYRCKGYGLQVVCSDWVEWRPPKGFYRHHSVVDAVNVMRAKVLPYGFGLIGRAAGVVGVPVDRFRSSLYGLARNLYLALRPKSSNSNGCRAPSVEFNDGDGSFSVCFKCPPTLYRRLINSARAARRDWNSIIVEVLSGVLP